MEVFSYLFSPIPGSSFTYDLHLYIYAAVLIVIGLLIVLLLKIRKEDKALKKTYISAPSQFIWLGFILLILVASRTSAIPYLSMRSLLFIAVGLSIYYIVKNVLLYFKKYPDMKKVVAPKTSKKEKKKGYSTSKK
jgi:hypothetical protein